MLHDACVSVNEDYVIVYLFRERERKKKKKKNSFPYKINE